MHLPSDRMSGRCGITLLHSHLLTTLRRGQLNLAVGTSTPKTPFSRPFHATNHSLIRAPDRDAATLGALRCRVTPTALRCRGTLSCALRCRGTQTSASSLP
eukprot:359544-Chlamydomonas_euryale.AAC.4